MKVQIRESMRLVSRLPHERRSREELYCAESSEARSLMFSLEKSIALRRPFPRRNASNRSAFACVRLSVPCAPHAAKAIGQRNLSQRPRLMI